MVMVYRTMKIQTLIMMEYSIPLKLKLMHMDALQILMVMEYQTMKT